MWQLNNLFAATPVHPGELLSVAAFEHLDAFRATGRAAWWRRTALL